MKDKRARGHVCLGLLRCRHKNPRSCLQASIPAVLRSVLKQASANMLFANISSASERERERETERGTEREGGREGGRDRGREGQRDRGREGERERGREGERERGRKERG